MIIAAYISENGHVTSLNQPGRMQIYTQDGDEWVTSGSTPFAISPGMRLSDVQAAVAALAESLGECRRIIVGDLHGLPCALLDSLGFSLWQGDGHVNAGQLDHIATADTEPADCAELCMGAQNAGDDDVLDFDLRSTLARHPEQNSRSVLVPLLESARFSKLDITCDHCPRWVSNNLALFGYEIERQVEERGHVRLVLVRNGQAASPALLRRFKGCGCGGGGCCG